MEKHLYLSLIPEALVASNLPPQEFGAYFATGVFRRNCDQAVFFEIDPNFESDYLPIDKFDKLCEPHPDGSPHSRFTFRSTACSNTSRCRRSKTCML